MIRLGSALGHVPGTVYPAEEEEPEETSCDQIAFQIMDELKESIHEVINETQETVNGVVHETQETVNEVVLETQDTFNEVFNETQDTFEEVVHETEELFQEVTHAICKFDHTDIMKSSDVVITDSKSGKGVES